ncbi:MAG: DUF7003 family protein [Gemmataceae bacterium]
MGHKRIFSATDILKQLDDAARTIQFPMLDNGYMYLATVRLHAYRDDPRWSDDFRWALVIEDLGWFNRAYEVWNILHCYGNCLKRPPGTANEDFLRMVEDGPEGPLFDEEFGEYVHERAQTARIRGKVVPINTNVDFFAAKGIELIEPQKVHGFELLRSLLPEHRDLLLATEEELRQRVPPDLPCLLRLDEWAHPDLCDGELPSDSETFQMIAEVLVSGEPARYAPTKPPNTHWSNWPEGGTL